MAKDNGSSEFYTGNELHQIIASLEESNASLSSYIHKLEEVLKVYKNKDGNETLSMLVKRNLEYEAQLKERDEKISELVSDLLSAEGDISDLEGKLKAALDDAARAESTLAYAAQKDDSQVN